jgi:hypothetical protein
MAENNNSMWKIIIGGAVAAALFPSLWYVGNLIVQDQVNKYISTDTFKGKAFESLGKDAIKQDNLLKVLLFKIESKKSTFISKNTKWENLSWSEKINHAFEVSFTDYSDEQAAAKKLKIGDDNGKQY